MSFVFISHACEDKQRLVPHLRALMARGLRLWIDRAHELGPEFDHQGRIATGEAWPSSIERALQECGCVLVFWSKHSVGPEKKVLRDEVGHGLSTGKLIQVTLDRGASAQLDRWFTRQQGERFYNLETEEDFDRA